MSKGKKLLKKRTHPLAKTCGAEHLGGAKESSTPGNIMNHAGSKWAKFDTKEAREGPWPAGHMPPRPAGQGVIYPPWCSSFAGMFFSCS